MKRQGYLGFPKALRLYQVVIVGSWTGKAASAHAVLVTVLLDSLRVAWVRHLPVTYLVCLLESERGRPLYFQEMFLLMVKLLCKRDYNVKQRFFPSLWVSGDSAASKDLEIARVSDKALEVYADEQKEPVMWGSTNCVPSQ